MKAGVCLTGMREKDNDEADKHEAGLCVIEKYEVGLCVIEKNEVGLCVIEKQEVGLCVIEIREKDRDESDNQ